MRICVLGSGSSGNCTYVAAGDTRVLVDAGLGYRDTCTRLAELGTTLDSVSGVLFTHHHGDHCKSAGPIWRRHATPLYANELTSDSIDSTDRNTVFKWNIFETGSLVTVGQLQVETFSVTHDANDTVGFVITSGGVRLGVATDLGMATPMVVSKLSDCDALILETNHDPEMLLQSRRPKGKITRIIGPSGHLSNEDAAKLLFRVLCPRLRTVFLAHRSSDCNTPFLAESALGTILIKAGREDIRLLHTYPEALSEMIEI
ncbi:MAG: MBL fold metallo-hydrolase [bacterium]